MKYMKDIVAIPIVGLQDDYKSQHDSQLAHYSKLLNEGYKDTSAHTMTVNNVGYMVFVVEKKLEGRNC